MIIDFLSTSQHIDCEKLIKKMLNVDATKRITMEQVMQDKWYIEGCESEPAQIVTAAQTPILTPDQQKGVLEELEELGMERDQVLKSINEGLYDSYTATYYLVADRRANGIPRATPTTVKPPVLAKKNTGSKANVLEVLDEDEDPDHPKPKKPTSKEQVKQVDDPAQLPSPSAPSSERKSASEQPPRIVSGRRRAQTATANDSIGQAPDLPPPGRAGMQMKGKVPEEFTQKQIGVLDQKAAFPPEQASALPPIPTSTPQAPPPQARARAHTVSVNPKDDEETTIPIDQFRTHLKADEARTARFTFSVSTTSTKEPPAVFEIVKKSLNEGQVKFTVSGLVATCKLNDVEFEIEVCKLPNLQVVGLRCKRLGGDAWAYKEILSSLIATMNL